MDPKESARARSPRASVGGDRQQIPSAGFRIIALIAIYAFLNLIGVYWEIVQGIRYRRYCRPRAIESGWRVKTIEALQAWWCHKGSYEDLIKANPGFSKLSVMYVLSRYDQIREDYLRGQDDS